ncbi:hypothetical protein IV203_013339 [Nitzschia inconspicua]|uniref:Uncharacterized protein n=1 Tax=Nitzschia inconspicua TaxID=303405 RepID=A0A9K3M5I4_9STRA|nr:hypothetical protein IV203_013339 [Nitzschia inconspicua]
MVAVQVRRRERERMRRSDAIKGDDRSVSSFDEFKVLAGERTHDFGEFETQKQNSITATTSKESNPKKEVCRNIAIDGSFYYEDRSEPAEDTLYLTGRGGEENTTKREDSPNVVELFMESDSNYEPENIVQQQTHPDETKEHDNDTRASTIGSHAASKPLPSLKLCRNDETASVTLNKEKQTPRKSILRPIGRGLFGGSVEDRSFSFRSPKSSARSVSSSFRSSEAGSISATSQSYLRPIARIKVIVTDDSGRETDTIGDDSQSPSLPSGVYGDDITDAGTALISANRGYHPRPAGEEMSEASSIILSGSYSSFSTSGASQTDSQETDRKNSHIKINGEVSRSYSKREAARVIDSPLEQMYSVDSNGNKKEKKPKITTRKVKMGQRLKKRMKRSARSMKYIFTGKILRNVFSEARKFGRSIVAVAKKPFSSRSNSEDVVQSQRNCLESKNSLIDQGLAHSLLDAHVEDESNVIRASRYVKIGRELLDEAAKIKDQNPKACTILTKKAHTYAYAARQIARKILVARKAITSVVMEGQLSKNISTEIIDGAQGPAAHQESDTAWKNKLKELQLFNFEDFLPSCFSTCGTCSAESSSSEVDEALEILAKLSEDDATASKSGISVNQRMRTIVTIDSSTSHAVANNSILSIDESDVETKVGSECAEYVSSGKSRTIAIRKLVTDLQSFYEADSTINGNSTTNTSTYQVERSTKDTSIPGGQTVEMNASNEKHTFEWAKLTRSLFNAEEEDEEEDYVGKKAGIAPRQIQDEQKNYHSDTSCQYTESLQDEGSSYSNTYSTDGASYTSRTRFSNASTSGRSTSKAPIAMRSTKKYERKRTKRNDVGHATEDLSSVIESSTHTRSSRSMFRMLGFKKKGTN